MSTLLDGDYVYPIFFYTSFLLRNGPYVLTHVIFLTFQSAHCADKDRVCVVPSHLEINGMPTFTGGHS